MPYEWDIDPEKAPASSGAFSHAQGDAPYARLHLWPYRSLPKRGFVGILAMAILGFLLPVIAFIGSPVLWGLLLPALVVLGLLWFFIDKSYRDGEILEELTIWNDHITLTRTGPKARVQTWEANPYWVSLKMHQKGGPVDNYLTLKGAERIVEIGAFLSPEERVKLNQVLQRFLG